MKNKFNPEVQSMREIILDLLPIHEAASCDKSNLRKVVHELTEDDVAKYDARGWEDYHPDNHTEYLLPELGPPVYLKCNYGPVVEINGKRWKVKLDFNYLHEPYEATGKRVILTETDEPPTESNAAPLDGWRGAYHLKVFGQPSWVQSPWYPLWRGRACSHLLTVECGWGDCGNQNVLVGLDANGDPEVGYFEASCC